MPLLKNILDPSQAVALGVGMGAFDLLVFRHYVPNMADVRSASPDNQDVETARRQATITCVGLNGLVSVMTGNWDVFLIGGAVTAALSLMTVHANAVNPATGKMQPSGNSATDQGMSDAGTNSQGWPLPDYSDNSEQLAPVA